jgi:acylphosphatase
MKIRIRAVISGRVQGVFYRATTLTEAKNLNVRGTVRNLPDGCVEVVAEGDDLAVQVLIKWCEQGPPSAWVEKIEQTQEPYQNEFSDFRIVS